MKKLKTLDSSYFIGKSHFEEDDAQNYLAFQTMKKYFKVIASDYISYWKYKGLSSETINLLLHLTIVSQIELLRYQNESKIY